MRDSFLILESWMIVIIQVQMPFSILLFFLDPLILRILDEPPCYVRWCLLVLKIVLYFYKCLGFCMHFISLYGALSLYNCLSSGSLVFAHLRGINLDCTLNNNSTDSFISYRGIYSS